MFGIEFLWMFRLNERASSQLGLDTDGRCRVQYSICYTLFTFAQSTPFAQRVQRARLSAYFCEILVFHYFRNLPTHLCYIYAMVRSFTPLLDTRAICGANMKHSDYKKGKLPTTGIARPFYTTVAVGWDVYQFPDVSKSRLV